MKITTIGVDLAKAVLQVHGVDEHGQVGLRKQLKRKGCGELLRESRALPDRHGSLWERALLGEEHGCDNTLVVVTAFQNRKR